VLHLLEHETSGLLALVLPSSADGSPLSHASASHLRPEGTEVQVGWPNAPIPWWDTPSSNGRNSRHSFASPTLIRS
jgi:hypothetical protein